MNNPDGEPIDAASADRRALARALDILGRRWALLLIHALSAGPARFGDLRHMLDGVSANVLAQRIADLERAGIIEGQRLPSPANCKVFRLREDGRNLGPILHGLAAWQRSLQSGNGSTPPNGF